MIEQPTARDFLQRTAARVRRSVWQARRVVNGRRGLILLYHRIVKSRSDPQRLAVTPRHFAEHLTVLRQATRPVSLRELRSAVARDGQQRPPVAVTFDDGYADNLDYGKPLLDRYDIPATVFATTSYLGTDREFWWDDLERLLLLPGRLPNVLRVRVGPTVHEWNLAGTEAYGEADYQRHVGWNVERVEDPTPRHHVYRSLCQLLRAVPSEQRDAAIDDLACLAGVTKAGRPTHRALSSDELAGLTADTHIEVGAHTVTHTALASLPLATQQSEISCGKTRLEEITGRPVTAFAYPFGGSRDYSPTTVGLVRDAGFTMACANVPKTVRRRSDPFQLPRVLVRDWDGDEFAHRLTEWLDG